MYVYVYKKLETHLAVGRLCHLYELWEQSLHQAHQRMQIGFPNQDFLDGFLLGYLNAWSAVSPRGLSQPWWQGTLPVHLFPTGH